MSCAPCRCSGELRTAILSVAKEAGACAAGFARVEPVEPRYVEAYRRWIERGMNGGMEYLDRYHEVRENPALLLEGARSMLCVAFPYRNGSMPRHPLFADYALGNDYHEVLRHALEPVARIMRESVDGSETRICIDTAPIRERYWAAKAGLGFIGLNNQLIIPGIGSAVFLAEILWTVDVTPSSSRIEESCIMCGRCVKSCPSGALQKDGTLDARRCLSYLTIEHRGELPEELSLVGRRIYGCDVCRDVCPYNSSNEMPVREEFKPSEELMKLTVADICRMEQPDFSRIFRHSAVKRAKLAGLLRNAEAAKQDS